MAARWKTLFPLHIVTSLRFFTNVSHTNVFLRGHKIIQWSDDHLLSQLRLYRFLDYHASPVWRAESSYHIDKEQGTNESNKHGTFSHTETLWQSVCAKPHKWYDFRLKKKNKKAPDFRHIETGERLWIESSETPAWVLSKLGCLGGEVFTPPPSVDEMFKSLFADPSKWFDNRKVKKDKNNPDFVHKENHNALWIDERTPAWVITMLGSLEDEKLKTSLSKENLWKFFFGDPSKWFDYRKIKKSNKHPDFKHRVTSEALWIDDLRNPAWITPLLNNLQDDVLATSPSIEALWKAFIADPSKWIDYRKVKKSNEHPDFKHKTTHEALWINDMRTPVWITPFLNNLQEDAFATPASEEDLWISLFVDPTMWVDNRRFKKSNKHPDFVHKDTYEALWIDNGKLPAWFTTKLKNLQNEAFAIPFSDHLWKLFFADPSKWIDYRKNKKNPKAPDFRHVDTEEALWINKSTSIWIISELNKLGNDAFASSNAK